MYNSFYNSINNYSYLYYSTYSFYSIDMKDGLDMIADCILTQFLPLLHIEILHSQFDLIYNFIARSLVNGNSIHVHI